MKKPKKIKSVQDLIDSALKSPPCVCEDYCRCDPERVVTESDLNDIIAAIRAEYDQKISSLQKDLDVYMNGYGPLNGR